MHVYDFELIKDGAVIAARRGVALPGIAAAWPLIVELAGTVEAPGLKIRVRDSTGGIVIQTGVASARRIYDGRLAA